jgi:hypothetical protein
MCGGKYLRQDILGSGQEHVEEDRSTLRLGFGTRPARVSHRFRMLIEAHSTY